MVHVSWNREIDSHVAHKEKENSPNEKYIASNPLVLPEAKLPLTSSHVVCVKSWPGLVWELLLIPKHKPLNLHKPFTLCVCSCACSSDWGLWSMKSSELFHFQIFFCCWKYLFHLVLMWSSKQTEKHPTIQNHGKFLFHTGDSFVLCPPAGLDYWVAMRCWAFRKYRHSTPCH